MSEENQTRSQVTVESLSQQETVIMAEAVEIINRQVLHLPEGVGSPAAERLVECIVSLSLLGMSKMLVATKPK